jgi:hypothetical protein
VYAIKIEACNVLAYLDFAYLLFLINALCHMINLKSCKKRASILFLYKLRKNAFRSSEKYFSFEQEIHILVTTSQGVPCNRSNMNQTFSSSIKNMHSSNFVTSYYDLMTLVIADFMFYILSKNCLMS